MMTEGCAPLAAPCPDGEALTVVICFDHASVTGGQARVAFDSAVGLRKAGHRPIVFTAAGPVSPELSAADVETICLDQSDLIGNPSKVAAAVQGIWNAQASRRLGALLAGLPRGRTLVHVHGWAKALSPSIAVPIARSGVPAAYTMHEYFQFCPNGGFFDYQKQAICTRQPLSPSCWATNCDSRTYSRKLWRNLRLLAARHLAGLPQVFSDYITISDLQRTVVEPLLPDGVRLHRLDNPIAVPDLGPKAMPAGGDFIFVGRLSPEKGVLVYAEASRRIGRRAVFVGDGPMAAILAERYPEAHLLGWHDTAGVRAALRGARALAFPSLWYEGQPLTVLEAKALGTPVIVSDACAGREAVEDGVSGLWFRSGDAEDLARAMLALDDAGRVTAMSQASYAAFWRRPPTPERHVDGLLTLYRSMLAAVDARLPASATRSIDARLQPQHAGL